MNQHERRELRGFVGITEPTTLPYKAEVSRLEPVGLALQDKPNLPAGHKIILVRTTRPRFRVSHPGGNFDGRNRRAQGLARRVIENTQATELDWRHRATRKQHGNLLKRSTRATARARRTRDWRGSRVGSPARIQ